MKKAWTLMNKWGGLYEISEFEYTTYKGGSLNAEYWHDGQYIGKGTFPVCELIELKRIDKASL